MNAVKRYVPTRRTTPQRNSQVWLLSSLALVLSLLAGCMPVQRTATNLSTNEAITLRFAISDEQGKPQIDPYVDEFVAQATHFRRAASPSNRPGMAAVVRLMGSRKG